MARQTFHIEYDVPESAYEAVHELLVKIGKDFLKQATIDIVWAIEKVIFTYMTHTTKHGWNYNYTGKLAKSFHADWDPKRKDTPFGTTIRNIIQSFHPAAGILQTGGIITPKKAKYLTVPLPNKVGITIQEAQMLRKSGRLFLRKGKLYLKLYGQAIPLFVLKPFVKMPKYQYLSKAIRKAGFRYSVS